VIHRAHVLEESERDPGSRGFARVRLDESLLHAARGVENMSNRLYVETSPFHATEALLT
jgi:hypothetical protein